MNDVPTVVDVTGVPTDGGRGARAGQLDPADDIHATAAYRAHLVTVLTGKVLADATADARGRLDA